MSRCAMRWNGLASLLLAIVPAACGAQGVSGPGASPAGRGVASVDGGAKEKGLDSGEVVVSVIAHWRCDAPGCTSQDWVGAVVPWPAWAAYQSNGRKGDNSRSVYSAAGEPLYPYMQSWAHGCKVTARSGRVLIVEWERGTDTWRETWLDPGESHLIDLVPPEDGAMIETYDNSPGFSVSLENCTPRRQATAGQR